MSKLGQKALSKLLNSAESRRLRGTSDRAVTVLFNERGLPGYDRASFQDRQACNAYLKEAHRNHAIKIDWDARAGDNAAVERIILDQGDALARYLGVTPAWDVIEQAYALVGPYMQRHGVPPIWGRWRENKPVRGLGPGSADKLVDACRVLDEAPIGAETPVRRLSARLFADSKHIETSLYGLLDELTRGPDEPITSHPHDVLRRLGLVKHPQPFLVSGPGRIHLTGDRAVALAHPYLGVAPETVAGVDADCVTDVLTVENLTTFNEAARLRPKGSGGLILYTGGVPSPAFRNAYQAIIQGLRPDTLFWHWGDIDEGGLRIAQMISELLTPEATLLPWLMNPAGVESQYLNGEAPEAVIKRMLYLARKLGWHNVADGIKRHPGRVEQEILKPLLPFS